MSTRTGKIVTNIEPRIESVFRALSEKRGLSCSSYIRALIIDEIRLNGLLPEDAAMSLLKGSRA